MGVPGLYTAIGNPERISLSKLAVDHYEKTGRRFRIAIDASIWFFQVKSSHGGANPGLRTLYYRLIRLLKLGIDPILVFDGENRPKEKRNKTVSASWTPTVAHQVRMLLDLFGFVHHQAPGEAEAECAILQQNGVVDAVFTEDVDALMFGATMVIRNWTNPEKRGSKSPTHVHVHRAEKIKACSGLDREGMVLMAVMSGGDYNTVGIDRCGSKTAHEAANAGFGHDLCDILIRKSGDLDEWRERLIYELKVNESGFFTKRHIKMASGIQSSFPDTSVAMLYLLPLVSSPLQIASLATRLASAREVDIHGLRAFVGEKLQWNTLAGAKKYIRGLAPAILTAALLDNHDASEGPPGLLAVCGSRTHSSSDGIAESRVEIRPIDLVPIDLAAEPLVRPLAEGDQVDVETEEDSDTPEVSNKAPSDEDLPSTTPAKRRLPSSYDPTVSEKHYIPELYAKKGAPVQVISWKEACMKPKPASPRKPKGKPRSKAKVKGITDTNMPHGAIEAYFAISKKISSQSSQIKEPFLLETARSGATDGIQAKVTTMPAIVKSPAALNADNGTSSWTGSKTQLSYSSHISTGEHRTARSALSRSSSETQPIYLSDDESEVLPTNTSTMLVSEAFTSIPSSPPFTSPASSQGLLQLEELLSGTEASQPDLAVPQPSVRLRFSLPGAWDTQATENPAKRGRRLGPLEVVDLT